MSTLLKFTFIILADNLDSMKKGSRAIKSGLRCFSCCYPYHDDKICINCGSSTSAIKRIQEFNESYSIHTKFVSILTKAYHSLKPIKWCINKTKNKQGRTRNKETRKQTNKQAKTLLYSALVLEIH